MSGLVLTFMVGGRRAAIASAAVQSVVEIGHIVPVPRAPDFIAGLTALRSRALTVIDTARAIGIESASNACDNRAAVIEVDGHAYALCVGRVEDVTEAMSDPVRPDASFGPAWDRVALGMVETAIGPAILLDVSALVTRPEIQGLAARAA